MITFGVLISFSRVIVTFTVIFAHALISILFIFISVIVTTSHFLFSGTTIIIIERTHNLFI